MLAAKLGHHQAPDRHDFRGWTFAAKEAIAGWKTGSVRGWRGAEGWFGIEASCDLQRSRRAPIGISEKQIPHPRSANKRGWVRDRQGSQSHAEDLLAYAATRGGTPAPGPADYLRPAHLHGAGAGSFAGRAAAGARGVCGCVHIGLPGRGAGALGRGARGAAGRLAGSAAGGFGGALRFPAADEVGGGVLVRLPLCGAGGGNPLGPGAVHPAGRRGDDGGPAAGHVSWRLRMDGSALLGGAGGGDVHGRSRAFVHGLPQPDARFGARFSGAPHGAAARGKRRGGVFAAAAGGAGQRLRLRKGNLRFSRRGTGADIRLDGLSLEMASGWLRRISR